MSVIMPPKSLQELKANRKCYHERQLFHLYALFLSGLFEVAINQNRTITFSWSDIGHENFPAVE